MVRVCVIREHYVPQDTRVAREVEALAGLGHQVDVICLRDTHQPWVQRRPGVTVWRVPLRHSRGRRPGRYLVEYGAFFVLAAGLVTLLHLRHRYRLVQVNSLPDALVFAAAVPRLLGARLLLDLQECMPEFFATKFGVHLAHPAVRAVARVERASIAFAHQVITPTAQMRDAFVARGAPRPKITVVMDGSDEDVFRPVQPSEAGAGFTLITHGTVEPHYGIDTVIEAVALLRDEIPGLRFDVYGDGSDLPRLRRIAAELGVADRVHFSGGYVPVEELVSAMARADVGVVAMRRDPFRDVTIAGKMFDFVAMGKPVVSSRTRAVEQTFGGSCVELFESGDARDLARVLRRLSRDPGRRRELARRATQVAVGYQWPRQREIYAAVVGQLLDRRDPVSDAGTAATPPPR